MLDRDDYARALAGEGRHWDTFIARRILDRELPGSVDWRLNFNQFRYKHHWLPLCFGPAAINLRLAEVKYLLTTAAPEPGRRVLDLGCAAGWLSLELARRGAHVTGVDISPANLAVARHMAATNERNFPYLYQRFAGLPCRLEDFGSAEYLFADLNTINLPRAEFDAVVVWDSLHHVAELERLLEEVRASLKPGGMFVGVDHAFASPRTLEFGEGLFSWLDELYSWISLHDPWWFYVGLNGVAREHDWGVLNVDYEHTPVPGFGPFVEALLDELREIALSNLGAETGLPGADPAGAEEVSPFEDVSNTRLVFALAERFEAREFRSIGPFVEPERHFPHYRNEAERIFQHYLAAMLVRVGEAAIDRGQTTGQWFLFHLTPEHPGRPLDTRALLEGTAEAGFAYVARLESQLRQSALHTASLEELVAAQRADIARMAETAEIQRSDIARLREALAGYPTAIGNLESALRNATAHNALQAEDLDRRAGYIQDLEAELLRKNAAIARLEARERQLEAELAAARRPRFPWKGGGRG